MYTVDSILEEFNSARITTDPKGFLGPFGTQRDLETLLVMPHQEDPDYPNTPIEVWVGFRHAEDDEEEERRKKSFTEALKDSRIGLCMTKVGRQTPSYILPSLLSEIDLQFAVFPQQLTEQFVLSLVRID